MEFNKKRLVWIKDNGKEGYLITVSAELKTKIRKLHYIIPCAITCLPIGGSDITKYLQQLLTQSGYSFVTSMETEITRDLKEQSGYICLDFDTEMKNDSNKCLLYYKKPDQAIISINTQRYKCCEIIFKPKLIGKKYKGIHELIIESIMKCDIDIHQQLYENVLLTGASSNINGIDERLLKELKYLAPDDMKDKIKIIK
eukprot:489709_1